MEHEAIAEAAVVGFPHEVKGEGVYAYITLKEGYKDRIKLVENELKQLVKKKISGSDRKEILLSFNFSNIALRLVLNNPKHASLILNPTCFILKLLRFMSQIKRNWQGYQNSIHLRGKG